MFLLPTIFVLINLSVLLLCVSIVRLFNFVFVLFFVSLVTDIDGDGGCQTTGPVPVMYSPVR